MGPGQGNEVNYNLSAMTLCKRPHYGNSAETRRRLFKSSEQLTIEEALPFVESTFGKPPSTVARGRHLELKSIDIVQVEVANLELGHGGAAVLQRQDSFAAGSGKRRHDQACRYCDPRTTAMAVSRCCLLF